ncbi:MAG: tetratricopeptide repeat protein [Bdellovibrionales bacterium]
MSKLKKQAVLIFVTFAFISAAFAQEESADFSSNGKAKNVKVAANAKPKTVGEILSNIKSQYKGRSLEITKYKTQLPRSELLAPPPAPKDIRAIKPPSSSEIFRAESTDEAKIEKITDQSIAQLYKIMQKHKTSPNRGEIWLRLAELYSEKSRLIETRKRDEYDKQLEAMQKAGRAGRPRLDLNLAKEYNKKAIQLYEWFLKDFPKDSRVDQALFFLGYNYFELGQIKEGLKHYDRLTREYKNSPYVSESNFALGEYYFENNDWKNALRYYQAVIANRRARLYTFALYKAGWCYYRTGKVRQAISSLESVVKVSRQKGGVDEDGKGRAVNRIRLASEALKDLIVFYAEVGDPRGAEAYFTNLAGDKLTFSLLEKLGYHYSDLGKREGAKFTFRRLLEIKPTAPKAFDYQYQIVMNYAASGDQKTFRKELYDWIVNYGSGSDWARANSRDKELMTKAYELRESTLRNHTLHLHKSAQASRASFSQSTSAQGYDLYVKAFPESKNIIEMRFFYGELLFDMGRYKDAGAQYLWVADNGVNTKYQEMAIVNMLLALEKELPSDDEISKRIGKSINPVEFTDAEKNFEASAKRYVNAFPKGDKVDDVKFKLGRLHYAFNHLDEALSYFWEVIKKYPKSSNTPYAANLILDIYNLRKDYDGLTRAANEMLQIPELARSGFGADVKGIVERAQFKKAQDLEVGKNYLESAKGYESFARSNRRSELSTSAQFNAAVNYERAGQSLEAIRMYNAVANSKDKPSEGLRTKSKRILAKLYDDTGQYYRAAQEYVVLTKTDPKDPLVADYHYNAAVMQAGLKMYPQAVKNFEMYYEKSRKKDRGEVFYSIAELFERQKAYARAIAYYKEYLKNGPRNHYHIVEAHYKIADYADRMRRRSEAKEYYEKTIAVQRRLANQTKGVGAWFAAEAKFRLTKPLLDSLKAIRIPANPAQQSAAVDKKLKLLNEMNLELAKVIKYDSGDQVVGALSLVGQGYDHMVKAIEGTPLPRGLNAQELEQYKQGIAKITEPFRQKALDNFQAAVNRSYELNANNEIVISSMRSLNVLKPGSVPSPGEPLNSERVPDLMGL